MPGKNGWLHTELLSIMIQSLHIVEAVLPCRINVQHIPRCSSPQSLLADQLSCQSTTTETALDYVAHILIHTPTGPMVQWLNTPTSDWELPQKIAEYTLNKT
jgi:hypothetical protein